MSELVVLKSMLRLDYFSKYYGVLNSIGNLEPEWRKILKAIKDYFVQYPDKTEISPTEIYTWFVYQNPGLKKQETYKNIFDRIAALDISNTELLTDILNSVIEKHTLAQISGAAIEVINGERNTAIAEIERLIAAYKAAINAARDAENEVCDIAISDLFAPEPNGIKWRLKFLNETIGPIKASTLGHVFARPDGGKTSFALSEITYLARQLPEDRPILYLNNEEDIRRVKRWAVCSLLGVSEEWIKENAPRAEELWRYNRGEQIKFIGEVHDIHQVEKYLQAYNPRIVVIDQGPKVVVPANSKMQGPDILKKLYNKYRTLAKQHETSIITLGQADDASTNRQWLGLTNIDSSKVGIPGELDWALGIGYIDDPKFISIRYLNIAKNKLTGRRGRKEVIFKMRQSRFSDSSVEV